MSDKISTQWCTELLDFKHWVYEDDLLEFAISLPWFDDLEDEMRKDIFKKLRGKNKTEVIFISSATGKNIQLLKDMLWMSMNDWFLLGI